MKNLIWYIANWIPLWEPHIILKHIYIILQFIFIFIPVRTHRLSNLFSHFTYAYQTFSQNISMPLGLANVLTWHFWITTSSFLCELKRKLNAVFIILCVLLKRSRWKKDFVWSCHEILKVKSWKCQFYSWRNSNDAWNVFIIKILL